MRNLCRSLLSLVAIALAPAAAAVELDGHILTVEEVGPASMIHSSVFVPLVCQDGIDNDGDGLVDAGEDPGCVDANDLSEHDPVTPPGAATFQPLGVWGTGSLAEDVSDDGSVVVGFGNASGGSYGDTVLRWENGVPEELPLPPGQRPFYGIAISGDGRVAVGTSLEVGPISVWRALRWVDGAVSELPGLGGRSRAYAASRDGSVIVGSVDSGIASAPAAARWEGGALATLTPLDWSWAGAVTRDGSRVAGSGRTPSPGYELLPAVWPGALPLWSHPSVFYGGIVDISDDASVMVGLVQTSGGPHISAFVWRSGQGAVLGEGMATSVAGDGSLAVGWGPSIWDASDHQRNLNDLLINDYGVDLAGWTLRPINGISGDGRTLVGWGINPDGDTEAWLVRLPPPCSDGLDNDGDGLVDFGQDPGCRSTEWSEDPECDDGVDNDGDGATDASDTRCFGPSDPNEACGLGFELVLVLPPLLWARRRLRRIGS